MSEREQFENYIEANYGLDAVYKTDNGEYCSHVTNVMWLAWQHQQQRLTLKDLEIVRLREALETSLNCIDRTGWEFSCNMRLFGKKLDRYKDLLSTPTTYDDLMAWHTAQPCQECENLKHDLASYMKMAHAYANQKPLSDDEIVELWGEKWSGSTEMIKNFARAIEKAHGIGE